MASKELMGWRDIPEPVLLMIYKLIEPEDVVSCGNVCIRWNQVHHDEPLWKYFLSTRFGVGITKNIQRKIDSGCLDLPEKYFCLKDHPSKSLQIFKKCYAYEVLRVCNELWISGDGSHLAGLRATSLVVWKRMGDEEKFQHNITIHLPAVGLAKLRNVYFNPSCTKLLVAGNSKTSFRLQILVFSIHNDTYHVIQHYRNFQDDGDHFIQGIRGKWLDDDYFMGFCIDNGSIRLSLWLNAAPNYTHNVRYRGGWASEKQDVSIRCDSDFCAFSDIAERHSFKCSHKSTSVCHCISPNSQRHAFQRKMIKLKEKMCMKDLKIISQKKYYEECTFWKPEFAEVQLSYAEVCRGKQGGCFDNDSKLCPQHIEYIQKEKMCLVYIFGDQTTLTTRNKIGIQPITLDFLNSKDCYVEPHKIIEFSDSIYDMVVSPDEDCLYISHRPNDGLIINDGDKDVEPETHNEWGLPSRNQIISSVNLKNFVIGRNTYYDKVLKENIPPGLVEKLQRPNFDNSEYYEFIPYLADVSQDFFATITGPHISIWDKEFGILLNRITLQNQMGDIILVKFNPKNQSELLTMNHTSYEHRYTKLQVWASEKTDKKENCAKCFHDCNKC